VSRSSVNSFSALGFSDDEAVVDSLRADLADIVRGYMERSQLSQVALAKKMGIPQSTVSAIKNDNIDKLSVEYFVRILTRLDLPWTARSWVAPHDAAVVQGTVPREWVAAGAHASRFVVGISGTPGQQYWTSLKLGFTFTGATSTSSSALVTVLKDRASG
jgi:predicted XRE-type DNA-binding protein